MSDTVFGSLSGRFARNIEIVDDAWLKDSLSDDEIDVPKDAMHDLNEDDDDEIAWDTGVPTSQNEVWGDLGLDHLLQELANAAQAESLGVVQTSKRKQ